MITRATVYQLIAFALITVVGVTYVTLRYVGLGDIVSGRSYVVSVDLAESGGIFEGAEVTYRGVTTGRVEALRLEGDGVRVDLRMDGGSQVPADTDAVVENRSAVGEQYLDLQPATASAPFLAGGDVIPRERTRTPVATETLLLDLDRLVNSVNKQDLQVVVSELGKAFAGGGRDLQRLLDAGDRLTLAATDALPETITLIEDGAIVLDTQRETGSSIRSFAADLADLSETLASPQTDSDLRAVLDRGVVASAELDGLLQDNRIRARRPADQPGHRRRGHGHARGRHRADAGHLSCGGGRRIHGGPGRRHVALRPGAQHHAGALHPGVRGHHEDRPQPDLRARAHQRRRPLHRGAGERHQRPRRAERALPRVRPVVRAAAELPGRRPRVVRRRTAGLAGDGRARARARRHQRGRRPRAAAPGSRIVTPATVRVSRPGRRAGTLALVVLLVLAVLGSLVVLATRIGPVLGQRGTDERRTQVLQQAKQAAVNFTTLDYESFDEDVELVLDGSTGTFREQFRAGVDDVRELVTQNRSRSVGTVREAALVSDDDDSARVLVVVDTEVTNVASTTPVPRHYRIQMDLTRTGDSWLVSDLTFVSSQVELPGGVADPGATPAPTTSAPTTTAPTTGATP